LTFTGKEAKKSFLNLKLLRHHLTDLRHHTRQLILTPARNLPDLL
jgi:hypothetical protein